MSKQSSEGPSPPQIPVDSSEGAVRDLLQSAGRRADVPAEELVEIRSVAKEQWREMARVEKERARFRRRNTTLALAASLLLAVAIGWWLMPNWRGSAPELVASVELVRGEVLVDGAVLASGSRLVEGTVLDTGSGPSGTALRLSGGQSVRLDLRTRVRLMADSVIDLERGAVYVDTANAVADAGVEIRTAYGTVRDIGTQFQVRLGDQGGNGHPLEVRVREGEVVLERRGTAPRTAKGGQKLALLRGGTVEQVAAESHNGAWGWIAAVTPAMDIEGASLAEYLEWVSRETGRELRYSSEALAESSKTIMLSGSIEDHTPEESLSILPSSGLEHRIENGQLLIEQP